MKLKFLEENYGIGKTSGKPYHMIKLADENTYENHVISYDPYYVKPGFGVEIPRGTNVELQGRLSTPYQNTGFIATSVNVAK